MPITDKTVTQEAAWTRGPWRSEGRGIYCCDELVAKAAFLVSLEESVANAKMMAYAPRLMRALEDLEVCANTVKECYSRRPENFALAMRSLEDSAKAARIIIAELEKQP